MNNMMMSKYYPRPLVRLESTQGKGLITREQASGYGCKGMIRLSIIG